PGPAGARGGSRPSQARGPEPGGQCGRRREGRGTRGGGDRRRGRRTSRAHRRERSGPGDSGRGAREALRAVLLDEDVRHGPRAGHRAGDRGRARRHPPARGQGAARQSLRDRAARDAGDEPCPGDRLTMAGEHVLIVDDEPAIRTSLRGVLEDEGYRVTAAASGADALAAVADDGHDLVFLDIWMPGMDGLETLTELRRLRPDATVVMISGHGTIETAVKATKLGAYDFIEKPLSLEKTLLAASRALDHGRLERQNRDLREQLGRGQRIVGQSRVVEEMRQQIAIAAPTNGRVLIHGENGSGKELVARAIHAQSTRRDGPFVEVNCAAIPEELIETELFGHERGAFTGAVARRRGRFELADGGTIFLDEIADMSLKTQAKVLRVLEEQAFERVGGKETLRVDVRVLAASNQNLQEQIALNRFREDLFYRLAVIPIEVPPLRQRQEDMPLLVE